MAKKNKLKVIHLAHASHSYFADEKDDLKKITLNDWYFKTASQTKKFYPEIEIECWAPEKDWKTYKEFNEKKIKLRFFPVVFSPIYALDFSLSMLRELKKEIKNNEKQGVKTIIHLHEYHNLHALLIATFFKKQKIIAQHHGGSWPLKHLKESKNKRWFLLFFLLGQIWENSVLKNIDCFYALSQEEINYLKKIASDSRIKFQTMGIEEEYFKSGNKRKARKKLKLNQNKKFVIFIGRVGEVKGIKYLLDAMTKLPDVELKIVGYGKEKKEFEDYAKKLKLKNTEFLGGVFGEKKLLYLDSADVLVLPSLKEGAPVTVMEALAKNLPVIVTNVGGVPLMIQNNREGIIIKQKNTNDIVKAIKKILIWKNKNVQKYANKYKWRNIIDDTVKDYENGK